MLSYQDSNLDKQNQKLLCYHYTIGQAIALSVKKRCKDNAMQAIFQIFFRLFCIISLVSRSELLPLYLQKSIK